MAETGPIPGPPGTRRLLDPQSTAAVVFGAHDWTSAGLGRAPSFRRSAKGIVDYLCGNSGLGLSSEFVLDLFDDPASAGEQLGRIRDTLDGLLRERRDEGRPVADVLVYYVGHGHTDDQGHLSLLVRRSLKNLEAETGIKTPDLARTLRLAAPQQRRLVVLDCCFSEAAAKAFIGMSASLDQSVAATAAKDLREDEPRRGTLLLCSSPLSEVSMAPSNAQRTLFTGAVLDVLREGAEGRPPALSFSDLRDAAFQRMVASFGANAPRPVLHQVNAAQGDLTRTPAFPNRAPAPPPTQGMSSPALPHPPALPATEILPPKAPPRPEPVRAPVPPPPAQERPRSPERDFRLGSPRERGGNDAWADQRLAQEPPPGMGAEAPPEPAPVPAADALRPGEADTATRPGQVVPSSPPVRALQPAWRKWSVLGGVAVVALGIGAVAWETNRPPPPADAPAPAPETVAPPPATAPAPAVVTPPPAATPAPRPTAVAPSPEENFRLGQQREREGNDAEAARLYRLAADQGHAGAQSNLGRSTSRAAAGWPRTSARPRGCTASPPTRATPGRRTTSACSTSRAAAGWPRTRREAVAPGTASPPTRATPWRSQRSACSTSTAAAGCPRTTPRPRACTASPPTRATPWRRPTSACSTSRAAAGCRRTSAEAARLYRLAADQGNAGAQSNLGVFYEQGRGGLPKDDAEAARLVPPRRRPGPRRGAGQPRPRLRAGPRRAAKDEPRPRACTASPPTRATPGRRTTSAASTSRAAAGCAKDDAEAARLYRLAADQGHAAAQTTSAGSTSRAAAGWPRTTREAARAVPPRRRPGPRRAQTNLGCSTSRAAAGCPRTTRRPPPLPPRRRPGQRRGAGQPRRLLRAGPRRAAQGRRRGGAPLPPRRRPGQRLGAVQPRLLLRAGPRRAAQGRRPGRAPLPPRRRPGQRRAQYNLGRFYEQGRGGPAARRERGHPLVPSGGAAREHRRATGSGPTGAELVSPRGRRRRYALYQPWPPACRPPRPSCQTLVSSTR